MRSYLLCHIKSVSTDTYSSLKVTTDDREIIINKFLAVRYNNSFMKGKNQRTTQKCFCSKKITNVYL